MIDYNHAVSATYVAEIRHMPGILRPFRRTRRYVVITMDDKTQHTISPKTFWKHSHQFGPMVIGDTYFTVSGMEL